MFDTQSQFSYGSNPASSFLQDSYNQSMYGGSGGGGALQNQFSNVMNSMQAGVTQSAQQGNIGNTGGEQMTPQQVAAQMNTGGVMSVLPMLGGSFLPKLMFPIAGIWSMISGIKAIGSFIVNVGKEREDGSKFDPSKLAYNKSLDEMYHVSQRMSDMGPYDMDFSNKY